MHLGALGNIRPRCRYADSYGNARHKEAAKQHREVHGAHNQQDAKHIDKKVVGENELTPKLISKEATDDGAYCCT